MDADVMFEPGDLVKCLKSWTAAGRDACVEVGKVYEVIEADASKVFLKGCGDTGFSWTPQRFKLFKGTLSREHIEYALAGESTRHFMERMCDQPPAPPAPLTGGSSEYYKLPPGATDIMDLIEHKDMGFALGNIFKAVYRLGDKPGTSQKYDLEKIIYFAQRELDRLQP